jgi:penicillin-binding protein 1C
LRLRLLRLAGATALAGTAALALATFASLAPLPRALPPTGEDGDEVSVVPRFVDRYGETLSLTYRNRWNRNDRVALREVPDLLRRAFIAAEDKRFYQHRGADWLARLNAAAANLRAFRAVRGASTITEQVVRMLYPRPRTLWSRWVEGFDAARLESRFSKSEILDFYLNQVPYARNRRGIAQAAREYFDRDVDTLDAKEMLALAVLVRSPSRLDLHKSLAPIEGPLERLAARLRRDGALSDSELARIGSERLRVTSPKLDLDAAHFVGHIPRTSPSRSPEIVETTLDGSLQRRAQQLLDRELAALGDRNVADGAVLVVDHETDEILAWVNGGGFAQEEGGQIDMVTAPRQPGSTLKPFVYALAMEDGWTAATVVDDEPTAEAVGNGLHHFRNYSRTYHGPVRIREALGNSLNVPAIKAIQFTGRGRFLELLHALGVASLSEHPDYYGDGIALGNGEISLFELVSAYAALGRGGVYRPLKFTRSADRRDARRVLSAETSSVIADILSDSEARAIEFGRNSVLALPVQTAVKTGTSNDYRDAWVVGFSHRYTIGVWMGNLDRRPMNTVTGSLGPALVFRALFAELNRNRESKPLYLSRRLRQISICRESGLLPTSSCPLTSEWFRPEAVPTRTCSFHSDKSLVRRSISAAAAAPTSTRDRIRVAQPSPGLFLALDPRIPDELERFELELDRLPVGARVEWWIDDALFTETSAERGRSLWPPQRGHHVAKARVWLSASAAPIWTDPVGFRVK